MADPTGISVAFAADALDEDVEWTRIDHPSGQRGAAAYTVERGRDSELDKTPPGTADIELVDTTGLFDPTNTTSPLHGYLKPSKQAAVCLYNPVTDTWSQIYRGFTREWDYELDETARVASASLSLEDGVAWLGNVHMVPADPPRFGDPVPAGTEGDIYYPGGDKLINDIDDPQPNDRIRQALDDAGWPGTGMDLHTGWRELFTGNVAVQPAPYSRGTPVLTVCLDAADAEFPGVANFWAAKDGTITFHGRYARFNPENVEYHIAHWRVGDVGVCQDDDRFVPFAKLGMRISADDIINEAMALPAHVSEQDVLDALVEDGTSKGQYGTRSLSDMQDLLTKHGAASPMTTAVEETAKFADYYVANQAQPRTRVTSLVFKARGVGTLNADRLWAFLCGAEINDRIELVTNHAGGGGFNEEFFIEHLRYEVKPARVDATTGEATLPELVLTVDVSPRAWFTSGTIYDERPT